MGHMITAARWIFSQLSETRNFSLGKTINCLLFAPSWLLFPSSHKSPSPVFLKLPQTHQDGRDNVSSVLEAVSVIAAPHETGSVDVFLLFIPVADLKKHKVLYKINWERN